MKKPIFGLIVSMLGLFLLAGQAPAQELFYKGKTLRMIVGTSAGGGFDTYTRTLARHFGKHVPGQPNIVVENMAGAGHLIGANHMYKVAKPDGLTLGHFHGGWFLYQLFNRSGIEFDATKFEFIGSPIKKSRACAFAKAQKAKLDIEPITGIEMAKLVNGIFKLNPSLAAKLKSILSPT